MPDPCNPFIRAVAAAAGAVCLLFASASVVAAQQSQEAPPPLAVAPTSPQFMSRYDFHLEAYKLTPGDVQFGWDTHFGGDFDLLDYVHGRTTFLIDYEAVLGHQNQPFDPNQGNYALEAATSVRTHGVEIYGVLHHISRHLGDRVKKVGVAWNVAQVRVLKQVGVAGTTIDLRGDAGKVIAHAFVDYGWTADADVVVRHPLAPRVGAYARGFVETFGIDSAVSQRSRQSGGRAEAGVRLLGTGGAIELFAGVERVVDADAFAAAPRRWAFAGFRMVTK